MVDVQEFLPLAVQFVTAAVSRALRIGDRYGKKAEPGGFSHVGDADMDNTRLAFNLFNGLSDLVVVEEELPHFSEWTAEKSVIFVDPIDGSAEIGSGGSQFCAAVALYGPYGVPVAAAAASPGLRPVFKAADGRLVGFGGAMGAVLSGTPQSVALAPLFKSGEAGTVLEVPRARPESLQSNNYTTVVLDLNLPSTSGLGSRIDGVEFGLAKMAFSNIFAQCQVILGHASATTFGPTVEPPLGVVSGIGYRGPKAWDILLPLTLGVGLELSDRHGVVTSRLQPEAFLDSFVMRRRLFLAHPEVTDECRREILNLRNITAK